MGGQSIVSNKFLTWIDALTLRLRVVDTDAEKTLSPTKRSREETGGGDPQPSPKKPYVDKACTVDTSTIDQVMVAESKLGDVPKDSSLARQIRGQSKYYIVNKAVPEATLPLHFYVGGMGRGGFKYMKPDEDLGSSIYEYSLSSDEDYV